MPKEPDPFSDPTVGVEPVRRSARLTRAGVLVWRSVMRYGSTCARVVEVALRRRESARRPRGPRRRSTRGDTRLPGRRVSRRTRRRPTASGVGRFRRIDGDDAELAELEVVDLVGCSVDHQLQVLVEVDLADVCRRDVDLVVVPSTAQARPAAGGGSVAATWARCRASSCPAGRRSARRRRRDRCRASAPRLGTLAVVASRGRARGDRAEDRDRREADDHAARRFTV